MGKDAQPQGARRGRLSLLVQPYHRAEQRDRDRDKSDPAPRHEADIVDIMAVAAAPVGDFGPCEEYRRSDAPRQTGWLHPVSFLRTMRGRSYTAPPPTPAARQPSFPFRCKIPP